jgi:predicted  nucleic acid-binding Zn-ribbon protein
MMNDELVALIHLQEVDLKIASLRDAIAALPKHLAAVEEKLRTQKIAVEQAEKAIKDEDLLRRRMESDLKDQQQKILKFREQSGSVKTNDQYRALQHEVAYAEGEIRKIEDRELESMERSEQLDAKLATAREELGWQIKIVEREKETARTASAEQQQQQTALTEERARLRAQIDAKLLANYDRIAGARRTGLARVTGQQCMACQMFLRPQIWNQVRGGELIPCESCARLMYFDPELEPVPEPPKVEASKRKKKADGGHPEAGTEA